MAAFKLLAECVPERAPAEGLLGGSWPDADMLWLAVLGRGLWDRHMGNLIFTAKGRNSPGDGGEQISLPPYKSLVVFNSDKSVTPKR